MRRRGVSGGAGCALLFVLLACVACVQSNSAADQASTPPLPAQPGEAPVLARVGVGRGAWSVAVSARLRRAYVTNRQDDTLSIVDLDTFQIVATTSVGSDPHNVVVDDAAGRAYVTLHGAYGVRADAVAVVATDSGALLATWPTGPFPAALDLDPGLGRLFVLSEGDNGVTVLDVHDGRSVARIDVPGNAMDLAVDAARARVYVASWLANVLLSYDTASLQQVGETALGPMPLRLAVGGRAERVYVTDGTSPGAEAGALWTVRAQPAAVSARPLGVMPLGVAVEREGEDVLVTDARRGTLAILDAEGRDVRWEWAVGAAPHAVYASRALGRAVVVLGGDDSLAVLAWPPA